jgi:hypothetical protein
MAAPEPSTCIDDPSDPALMTPEQRLEEVAALLAVGLRRWAALRLAVDAMSEPPTPADASSHSATPATSLTPADSKTISAHST